MNARSIYNELLRLNVVLYINPEGRLAYESPVGVMSDERLASVRAHRNGLLAIVEPVEERAAIMEFDAALTRAEAEQLARLEVVTQRDTCPAVSIHTNA